jgi:hypothetical protein
VRARSRSAEAAAETAPTLRREDAGEARAADVPLSARQRAELRDKVARARLESCHEDGDAWKTAKLGDCFEDRLIMAVAMHRIRVGRTAGGAYKRVASAAQEDA